MRRTQTLGLGLAVLMTAPLYLTYRTYKVYLGRIDDERRHVEEMADLHLATIEALALAIDASEDSVGYGLRILRTAGLVEARKSGRTVYYRLAASFPEPLLEHCLRELIHLSQLAASR